MTTFSRNPFAADPDRHAIWEILMRRDFEAFVASDWSLVAEDFLEEPFHGIDSRKLSNPGEWRLRFPDLPSYKTEWLKQAGEFRNVELRGISKLDFLFQASRLDEIELSGERAMARKKFQGRATTTTSAVIELVWQSQYLLRKVSGRWKITGFVGYLPYPLR